MNPFAEKYKHELEQGSIEPVSYSRPDVAETDGRWFLEMARFRYAQYCSGVGLINPSGYLSGRKKTVAELRQYAAGDQDIMRYREQLDVLVSAEQKNNTLAAANEGDTSFLNINWENVKVWPVYLNRVIDRLMDVEFDPSVVAVDSGSVAKKEMAFLRDKLAANPEFKEFAATTGRFPDNVSEGVENMSPEDVDILKQLGGYRTAAEIELQEFIRNTLELSSYSPVVRRQMLEDLTNLGACAVHSRGNGFQSIEYVDIPGLIAPASAYADCRDIDYAGFVRRLSMASIRAESNLPEATLSDVAKLCSSHYGNSRYMKGALLEDGWREGFHGGAQAYDTFNADVMTLYFIGTETERYITGRGAMGGLIFDKVGRNSTLNKRNIEMGKSMFDTTTQYVYRVNWIIGTDVVYDFGKTEITARDGQPGEMRAVLPISIYRIFGPSLTESMIPVIDDLQLAILKGRSIINKMPPSPGVGVDISALENGVVLGDVSFTPEMLMELYATKGYLYYRSRPEYALPGEQQQAKPIFEIPDNTVQKLQSVSIMVDNALRMMSLTSGSNEIVDGTGSANRVQNKVAGAYEESSNRALSSLYVANESISLQLITMIGRRYQAAMSAGPIEQKVASKGSAVVRTIRLLPEYSVSEYQFYARGLESKEIRSKVMETLMMNRQNAMINEADYLIVLRHLHDGFVDLAQFYLVRAITKKQQMDEQSKQAAIQLQAQSQQQAAVAIEEAGTKREMTVMEAEKAKIQLEYDLKDRNAQRQMNYDIEKASATPAPARMS